MSVDVSKVVHICPICDAEFGSHGRVRRHVTNTEDEHHQGINGFNMDMTIVTDTEDTWDVESEQELHNNIVKAADYFDEITFNEVSEIAEKANVQEHRVVRVFKDENIDFSSVDRRMNTSTKEITDKQFAVLKEWNGKGDSRSYRAIAREVNRKNKDIDISLSYPSEVIRKYGWMKLPMYDGSKFKEQHTDGGNVTVENNTDELVESASVYLESDADGETETDSSEHNTDTITEEDVYDAFVDSDVEFTVVPDEDEFDVMSKLIKSGHDDIARHIFE